VSQLRVDELDGAFRSAPIVQVEVAGKNDDLVFMKIGHGWER